MVLCTALSFQGCAAFGGWRSGVVHSRIVGCWGRRARALAAGDEKSDEDNMIVSVRPPAKDGMATSGEEGGDYEVTIRTPSASSVAAIQVDEESSDTVVSIRAPTATVAADGEASTPVLDQSLLDAVRGGDLRAVIDALKRGASPDARDPQGFSALHLCAATGLAPAVLFLARAGANMDYKAQNLTPLGMAIGYTKPFTAEVLIKCGADVQVEDGDGNKALDFVQELLEREKEKADEERKKETMFTQVVSKREEMLENIVATIRAVPSGGSYRSEEVEEFIRTSIVELDNLLELGLAGES